MYMHLFRLHKTLRRDGAVGDKRYRPLHVFPCGFPKLVAKSRFSQVPMRFGLCYLSVASRGQAKEVLPFVRSRFDADPTSILHAVEGPSQGCTVHYEAFAQPFLIHLAGCGQRHEQSELCNLEARLLQFLVINPRHDPRRATKVLADARQVKERFCGGPSACFRAHNVCIYNYRDMPVNSPLLSPIARLINSMAARLRTIRESGFTLR